MLHCCEDCIIRFLFSLRVKYENTIAREGKQIIGLNINPLPYNLIVTMRTIVNHSANVWEKTKIWQYT